jgi:hypothetical protein
MGGTVYNLSDEQKEMSEWTTRSRKKGICGIVKCFNKPTTQCKRCTNYYCSEHFPFHLDILPEGYSGFDYATPSNGGLDAYMD